MKKLQIALVVSVAVFGQGCATIKGLFGGKGVDTAALEKAQAEAAKNAKVLADAVPYATDQCEWIKTSVLSWEEERAVGSATIVGLTMNNGRMFIDGMVEKDPAKLMGADAAKAQLPPNEKNALTSYVATVGKNLARFSERPALPWTFAVIENDSLNAFSAPGGYVVVTTGLLKKMTNEAQLAGVLGHEIGHVAHRDSINTYKDAKHAQCIVAMTAEYVVKNSTAPIDEATKRNVKFADKFRKGVNPDLDNSEPGFVMFLVEKVIELKNTFGSSKDAELHADNTALQLVAFAGYDPTEYEKFLVQVQGSGGGLFSNHPKVEDRVAALKKARESDDSVKSGERELGGVKSFCVGTAKPDISAKTAVIPAPKS
jgi:beta-barrel assembly-enhancing protease